MARNPVSGTGLQVYLDNLRGAIRSIGFIAKARENEKSSLQILSRSILIITGVELLILFE